MTGCLWSMVEEVQLDISEENLCWGAEGLDSLRLVRHLPART
jgi:hypothetical protein